MSYVLFKIYYICKNINQNQYEKAITKKQLQKSNGKI